MRPSKLGSGGQAQALRHLCPQHHFHRGSPRAAIGYRRAEMRQIVWRAAHDPVALKTVAQAHRNQLGDHGMFCQGLHIGQCHIATGRIQVKHACQDELQGAAFGTHHQVDARKIALKSVFHLV